AAGRNDPVEGASIDDEVLDHRKGARPPGLDREGVAVLEAAHVKLAGRGLRARSMGPAVDDDAAGAADPLAAVVVERDRVLALEHEPLVDDVEHLEEGHLLAD